MIPLLGRNFPEYSSLVSATSKLDSIPYQDLEIAEKLVLLRVLIDDIQNQAWFGEALNELTKQAAEQCREIRAQTSHEKEALIQLGYDFKKKTTSKGKQKDKASTTPLPSVSTPATTTSPNPLEQDPEYSPQVLKQLDQHNKNKAARSKQLDLIKFLSQTRLQSFGWDQEYREWFTFRSERSKLYCRWEDDESNYQWGSIDSLALLDTYLSKCLHPKQDAGLIHSLSVFREYIIKGWTEDEDMSVNESEEHESDLEETPGKRTRRGAAVKAMESIGDASMNMHSQARMQARLKSRAVKLEERTEWSENLATPSNFSSYMNNRQEAMDPSSDKYWYLPNRFLDAPDASSTKDAALRLLEDLSHLSIQMFTNDEDPKSRAELAQDQDQDESTDEEDDYPMYARKPRKLRAFMDLLPKELDSKAKWQKEISEVRSRASRSAEEARKALVRVLELMAFVEAVFNVQPGKSDQEVQEVAAPAFAWFPQLLAQFQGRQNYECFMPFNLVNQRVCVGEKGQPLFGQIVEVVRPEETGKDKSKPVVEVEKCASPKQGTFNKPASTMEVVDMTQDEPRVLQVDKGGNMGDLKNQPKKFSLVDGSSGVEASSIGGESSTSRITPSNPSKPPPSWVQVVDLLSSKSNTHGDESTRVEKTEEDPSRVNIRQASMYRVQFPSSSSLWTYFQIQQGLCLLEEVEARALMNRHVDVYATLWNTKLWRTQEERQAFLGMFSKCSTCSNVAYILYILYAKINYAMYKSK